MRTTIDIPNEILRLAKQRAADTRVSLRQIVEAALRSYLLGRTTETKYHLNWTPERGRLQPGVDLGDRRKLHDLMDGRE